MKNETMSHYPKNNGGSDIQYSFFDNKADDERISAVLNEVCHVYYFHSEGVWQTDDKDNYARLIANEIRKNRSLTPKLLATEDRVIKMITYRAVELLESEIQCEC